MGVVEGGKERKWMQQKDDIHWQRRWLIELKAYRKVRCNIEHIFVGPCLQLKVDLELGFKAVALCLKAAPGRAGSLFTNSNSA